LKKGCLESKRQKVSERTMDARLSKKEIDPPSEIALASNKWYTILDPCQFSDLGEESRDSNVITPKDQR